MKFKYRAVFVQPLRFPGGFLLTSPLDASPFEQEDNQPLIDVLNTHQNYGTTIPLTAQSPEPPTQAPNSDSAESDNIDDNSVQSQSCKVQPKSRDGFSSLQVPGKKMSQKNSTF